MMKVKTENILEKDKKYLWHPFAQMKDWQAEEVPVIERAKGCYLYDDEGKAYLDGVSSLWCNVHGHGVPEIDSAIKEQIDKVSHTTFLGLTHPTAVQLAEKLVDITPEPLTRVFYSDSGSEAAEIALKMAFQYWKHRGKEGKTKFIKLQHAYHGDTVGAVSVGGMDLFHRIFSELLFETLEVPAPYTYRWHEELSDEEVGEQCLKRLEDLLESHHEEVAAFVMEPMVQGAAGMITQPPGFMKRARELTERYGVLLIFDEVATGFGRTGKMFACEHEGVAPDLMTVAKGITGGYLPLAATLATEEIYEAFLGDYEELKTFFHGHTYTANPLACAASLASLEVFKKDHTLKELEDKIKLLRKRLSMFSALKHVGDIRQVGMMVGIELVLDKNTKEAYPLKRNIGHQVIKRARRHGVIIRPLGSVIVLMPPLSISGEELNTLLDVTFKSIQEETENI